MHILYNGLLILLVVLSAIIIFTHKLRVAIILSGSCSMFAALVYLFLAAPDVALAEAIIGSTLATIILLSGTQKYRVCTVCALPSDTKMEMKLWSCIHRCTTKKELEANLVHVKTQTELHDHFYDIGYKVECEKITLFGEEDSYVMKDVLSDISREFPETNIEIIKPIARRL